jgi:hypothetical protein
MADDRRAPFKPAACEISGMFRNPTDSLGEHQEAAASLPRQMAAQSRLYLTPGTMVLLTNPIHAC